MQKNSRGVSGTLVSFHLTLLGNQFSLADFVRFKATLASSSQSGLGGVHLA